ncbi:SMP-30/gluconolactonase/LRE family protein [Micromonosporaceae bacterium Da 78-11]
MTDPRVVLTGLVMGESARWHGGRLWFSDWGAGEIIRVDDGRPEVVARMDGFPFCLDWLPDGRLLVLDGPGGRLLRQDSEPGGRSLRLVVHADLRRLGGTHPWNDIAADSRGNAFVNNIGYDFPGGEPAPGLIAVVTPDGATRQVADGLLFPNGMAVTADDATLIVAESHGSRLTAFDIAPDGTLGDRRVWAPLPDAAPDGICVDSSGAVWYADVPNRRCVRVREGGEILATVPLDRGGFDCALTDDPEDPTLYVLTADYTDPAMFTSRTGRLVAASVAVAA